MLPTKYSILLLLLLLCLVSCCHATEIQVDGAKVSEQLKRLATFSDDPNPDVTRILFTGLFITMNFSILLALWTLRRGPSMNKA